MEFLKEGEFMNKIINNRTEYDDALSVVENLLDLDPSPGTPENEKLDLLTLLIQDYEARYFQIVPPTPIEAIKFRMEQQSLTQRDLIPYIGSRSRVSEVLSGKRTLTISMIRALNSGLGIPAEILLQEQYPGELVEIDWNRFPIKQMISWGWIKAPDEPKSFEVKDILYPYFENIGAMNLQSALCRSSTHVRSARKMDDYGFAAWAARVLEKAMKVTSKTKYKPGILDIEFLHELSHLSVSEEGPLRAIEYLNTYGIKVIVERHLPRIYLDGAAIIPERSNPVIGLTIRYDRIDNFWFTLMHELAHISLHFDTGSDMFYDDLDIEAEEDPREREANDLAGEALIPKDAWQNSPASRLKSPQAAEHLAKQLNIHPAIVAGRMQHEFKAFQLLTNLVGRKQVRKLFPDVNWK